MNTQSHAETAQAILAEACDQPGCTSRLGWEHPMRAAEVHALLAIAEAVRELTDRIGGSREIES